MDRIVSIHPLTRARRDHGWSQGELGSRSGVSRAAVSAIETGRIVPSVMVALRLAEALHTRVEDLFGATPTPPSPSWAWPPPAGEGRTWQAELQGTVVSYPVEVTAAGALPHDAWFDGTAVQRRTDVAADRTLVIAGCDPLVGMLLGEMAARHQVRVLPLLRSSTQALDLLRRGLAHVAGLHLTDPNARSTNAKAVRSQLGPGFRLIHQVRWEFGVALDATRVERSVPALLKAGVRWVNREEGSAARASFDALLGTARPAGYDHVVGDHRAVAATVSSGWAQAGVCVRPVAAERGLTFIAVHREAYELCVPEALLDDPRVVALLATLQSSSYRQLLGEIPGCSSAHTGDLRVVA